MHYFRNFSKYSHWICIFDISKFRSSNWFSRAIFPLNKWTIDSSSLCFLIINFISFFRILAQKDSRGSCSKRVLELQYPTSKFHTIRGQGPCIEKLYLISSKWLTLLGDPVWSETFSIYSPGTPDFFQFVFLITNKGAKYWEREKSDTNSSSEIFRRRRKTAARVPETRLLPEISLGRECPQATCGAVKNPLKPATKLSSKWWLESSRVKW